MNKKSLIFSLVLVSGFSEKLDIRQISTVPVSGASPLVRILIILKFFLATFLKII